MDTVKVVDVSVPVKDEPELSATEIQERAMWIWTWSDNHSTYRMTTSLSV
jgi:hypothetical protein